jgi:hypothetical protein
VLAHESPKDEGPQQRARRFEGFAVDALCGVAAYATGAELLVAAVVGPFVVGSVLSRRDAMRGGLHNGSVVHADPFARVQLTGGRFDGEGMPVETLLKSPRIASPFVEAPSERDG